MRCGSDHALQTVTIERIRGAARRQIANRHPLLLGASSRRRRQCWVGTGVKMATLKGSSTAAGNSACACSWTVCKPRSTRFSRPERGSACVHCLSVLHDGELAGEVSWLPVLHGPTYGCLVWVIGVTLMPQFRRRGIGTAAHALLVTHLFATTDVDRIEAETDVDNASERRGLEKSGFTLDGVLRGAQLSGGRRHDLAVYSRLRSGPSPWHPDALTTRGRSITRRPSVS
ncbi:MAG: GNAT family protein [bacterium]